MVFIRALASAPQQIFPPAEPALGASEASDECSVSVTRPKAEERCVKVSPESILAVALPGPYIKFYNFRFWPKLRALKNRVPNIRCSRKLAWIYILVNLVHSQKISTNG